MTDQLGIGLVGTGFLAKTRARCYARVPGGRAKLVHVVSRTADGARDFGERHGVVRHGTELDALLADAEIGAVDLCVPNLLHRPFAERAAAAGKHVFCTKPLTAYVGQDLDPSATDADISGRDAGEMQKVAVADAQAMVDAAREHGVKLLYGENWLFAPSFVRAAELLATAPGSALEMRGWECHNGSHSPYSKVWRYTGGGALLRLGAHPLGAMLSLKREEGLRRGGSPIRAIAVTAETADLTQNPALRESESDVVTGWQDVENWGCAILHFEDGSRGVAYGSDNVLGGMASKLEIYSSDSRLECNLSPNDLLRSYASRPEVFGEQYVMEKASTPAGWNTPMPDEDWTSGQQGMIDAFVATILDGKPCVSDGELGLEVTRVLYAAYQSARDGRRVSLESHRR